MSTEKTDTTSSVDGAAGSPDLTASDKEVENEKKVEVSQTELDDLAGLLHTYRSAIIGHEAALIDHEGRITKLEASKPVRLDIPRGRSR